MNKRALSITLLMTGLIACQTSPVPSTKVCWDGTPAIGLADCPSPPLGVKLVLGGGMKGEVLVSWDKDTISGMWGDISNEGGMLMEFSYSHFDKKYSVVRDIDRAPESFLVSDFSNGEFTVVDGSGNSQQTPECILQTVYSYFATENQQGIPIELRCPLELT